MELTGLELKYFRNYEDLSLTFDKGTNIFYGGNAQGKTNILEAIFLGCTSRSHRSVKDKELIRFGAPEGHVKLLLNKNGIDYRIDLHIKKNRSKGIAVNGAALRKMSDLFGIARVIFFSPEDLSLIKNGPAERRRFLDTELCQIDRIYTHDLISYNRVIDQKNKLLKKICEKGKKTEEETAVLSIYNEQLCKYGASIIEARDRFIRDLSVIVKEKHKELTDGAEDLSMTYEPDVKAKDLEKEILLSAEREERMGAAMTGPHRDDICFKVNGVDLRHFGSQGQQRTGALSLKLSEIALMENATGEKPVLLLDDVLSELDRKRQDMLLSSLTGVQVFITSTGIDDLIERRFRMDRIFFVDKGKVTDSVS